MMKRFDLFPTNVLLEQYRRVFSSRNGLDVLQHILYDLGVFQPCADTPGEIELKNYGNRLLTILGAGQPDERTIQTFTKSLMKQPLTKDV